MKILCIVVIYNISIRESLTLHTLKNNNVFDVVIADNSDIDIDNESLCYKGNLIYESMGGNIGLSKAYNMIIDKYKNDYDIFTIFDDDTVVDERYFKELIDKADKHSKINIFAPFVYDEVGLLSPCIINGIKAIRIDDYNLITEEKVSIINSGISIRSNLLNNYMFDEKLFMDYVDHSFIKDSINNDKNKIYFLNVKLQQTFSGSSSVGLKQGMERYRRFKKDLLTFSKKYNMSKMETRILLARRMLKQLFLTAIYYIKSVKVAIKNLITFLFV